MDEKTRTYFNNIYSPDRAIQHTAFMNLLSMTDEPVEWAYEVWQELVAGLTHENNRVRAIASQLLINLAKSDPEDKILIDLDALFEVTRDKRFVTARHCLQSLWKVGIESEEHRAQVMKGLESRYFECASEKNCTLIRFDIIQDMRNLYDEIPDKQIKARALQLIEIESDPKYQKKYAKLWKD